MMIAHLFKLGIPTYTITLYTTLPAAAEQEIQISKELPKSIGRIYGISIYADTVTPDNKALITTTDAQNLYMTLRDGTNEFFADTRLDDFLSVFSGTPVTRPQNWFSCNIPKTIDLSTSFYSNPTGIVAGASSKTIALKLLYVENRTYKEMLKHGIVFEDAEDMKGKDLKNY